MSSLNFATYKMPNYNYLTEAQYLSSIALKGRKPAKIFVHLYLKELLPILKKQDLQPPLCRLVLFEHSFIPAGIRQWNMLPENMQEIPSVETFNQNIRTNERILLHNL